MVGHLRWHDLLLIGRLGLWVPISGLGLCRQAATVPAPRQPRKRSTSRAQDLNPFPGLTTKPTWVACEQAQEPADPRPEAPPPLMVATRGRPREVDPPQPYGPHSPGSYDGWVGLGHIRANGHPSGGRWRPFHGLRCQGYCLETHGTPRHGQHVPPERLVWAVGAWAEGLGIRAVARGFEVDPNTVRAWVLEVGDHATALSRYGLPDGQAMQVQLDERLALLRAVKAGAVSDTEAIRRLSRSPHGLWVAIDPVRKRLRAI